MAKIDFITRNTHSRYAQGTNFVKGDYLETVVSFIAHLMGGGAKEISRADIWRLSGKNGQRITKNVLDACKGKDL